MTAKEISRRLADRADEFARHIFSNAVRAGSSYRVGSLAGEAGFSLHVHVEGQRCGSWCDFAGDPDDRGDFIGLIMRVRGCDLHAACEEACDWLNLSPEEREATRPAGQKAPPKPIETRAPSETWLRVQRNMRPGTFAELQSLAALRKLPVVVGLELATQAGQLWFGDVHDDGFDWPAWILTDGSRHSGQARKVDGTLWTFAPGRKPQKAKTLPGCDPKWPVGITEAADRDTIFLVEGGPDLLAAWHLIWLGEGLKTHAAVAIFGASNPIRADALPLFRGKAVRIFPHNDPKMEGMNAGIRWRRQLIEAGTRAVDFFDFKPSGKKDLNEIVTHYGVPELKAVG